MPPLTKVTCSRCARVRRLKLRPGQHTRMMCEACRRSPQRVKEMRERALQRVLNRKKTDPDFRKSMQAYHDAHRVRLRREVILKYGGKCACCGEQQYEFLSLDHVNGGGGVERRLYGQSSTYYRVKREGFPKTFRVLCHNCNLARGFYSYCPHEGVPKWASEKEAKVLAEISRIAENRKRRGKFCKVGHRFNKANPYVYGAGCSLCKAAWYERRKNCGLLRP